MKPIRFLLDEDSQARSVQDVITSCGHEVILAVDALYPGAEDADVRRHANDISATLVTRNRKHFKRALSRTGSRAKSACAVLYLMCGKHSDGARRLEQFMPLIELEFSECRQLDDPRVVIDLDSKRLALVR